MNDKDQYSPDDLLILFDKIISDNPYYRRVAVKPLCDYYKALLLKIAVTYFECDKKLMMNHGLLTRWNFIKIRLQTEVKDCDQWDDIFTKLNEYRNQVEHGDEIFPKKKELKDLRDKIPEFQKWIITNSRQFFKKIKNLSFKDRFYSEYEWIIREADALLHEFGDDPHISFEFDSRWNNVSVLKDAMKEKLTQVDKIKEIEYDDLNNLLQLKELISLFRGREDMLLHQSRCPKCGGKITSTNTSFGGTPDDPEPDGIYYRVGCEKCDYYLDSDTI